MPSGRPQGAQNKAKERLFKALAKEYGDDFDPILLMAKNASYLQGIANKAMDSGVDATEACQDANKEWEKIAPFVQAKMKQVDVNAEVESIINIITDRK